MRIGSLVVLVWLLIGVFAAYQRDYFDGEVDDCNKVASIAATVVVGPLNYMGVNPQITCELPQPSQ